MLDSICNILASLPFACMESRFMQEAVVALVLLTPVTGILGVEVVNLRMAFFSDAIGHTAFAGLALGMMLSLPIALGMLAFAVFAGWAIVFLGKRKNMSADAATGVVFSAIVALGLLLVSRDPASSGLNQLFLYGDILTIDDSDICWLALLGAITALFHFFAFNPLLRIAINSNVASVEGIRVDRWQYAFSALLAVTVIFSVWAVGVLLVTALLVVPASAARNFAASAGAMFWWSIVISISSGISGLMLSAQEWLAASTGACIIIIACLWFLASLAYASLLRRSSN